MSNTITYKNFQAQLIPSFLNPGNFSNIPITQTKSLFLSSIKHCNLPPISLITPFSVSLRGLKNWNSTVFQILARASISVQQHSMLS